MTRIRTAVPALLVAGSLALAGCSGGADGPAVDPSAPPSTAAPSPGARAAADWLTAELTDGLVVNEQFDVADVGLTLDVALGLSAVDPVAAEEVAAAATAPRTLAGYVGDPDEAAYAGATAKAAVLVETVGADPTDVGGTDLLAQLEGLVEPREPSAGRVVDSGPQDFAIVGGQTYALRALEGAEEQAEGGRVADDVSAFLVEQQCDDGGFRSTFSPVRAAEQGCGPDDGSDVDTTALAVVALLGRADDDAGAADAAGRGVDWLQEQQADDGSFAGGVVGAQDAPVANANSTGLAGQALAAAGEDDAVRAAAGWLGGLQVGSDAPQPLAADVGAVAYDDPAFTLGARDGIGVREQDQWRRTTAQAVLALASVPGA